MRFSFLIFQKWCLWSARMKHLQFLWIFDAFSPILMSNETTQVTTASILFSRFMGKSAIVRVKGSVKAVPTQKKETVEKKQWQLQKREAERLQVWKCRDKINQTGLLFFFFYKKAKKRKWSPALLYPNMPSILSRRAEERRDIIISPPWAVSLY